MFTGVDSQRFPAFDEQKTTEHSNPADADAADGYFNEPHFHLMVTTMMMMMPNLNFSLPEKLFRVLTVEFTDFKSFQRSNYGPYLKGQPNILG